MEFAAQSQGLLSLRTPVVSVGRSPVCRRQAEVSEVAGLPQRPLPAPGRWGP